MADIYLRSSDGNDVDNGTSWALAKATLSAALTSAGAGGRVFMSHNHSESVTTQTYTGGAINAPIQILSVDDTGSPEPPTALLTGGSVVNTSNLVIQGYLYFHGVSISASNNFSFVNIETKVTLENCALAFTGSADEFIVGSSGEDVLVHIKGGTFDFGNSSNGIQITGAGIILWEGGALIGVAPTSLVKQFVSGGKITLRRVDLSILTGNIISPIGTSGHVETLIERCKLNASASAIAAPIQGAGVNQVRCHSCDSGNTTYSITEESYEGTVIDETTIVRTGGSSDGTTSVSYKMTTNANAIESLQPLISPQIVAWTDKTVSTTFTIEIIHDSLTNLKDNEIWVELEYPGSNAQGLSTHDGITDLLSAPVDQDASTEAWTTTGLTNPNKQKLAVTVTPGKVGPITARVYFARPSNTVYIDMKITEL